MSAPPIHHYILSLPERVLRSLSALSGGLLRELGAVVGCPDLRAAARHFAPGRASWTQRLLGKERL